MSNEFYIKSKGQGSLREFYSSNTYVVTKFFTGPSSDENEKSLRKIFAAAFKVLDFTKVLSQNGGGVQNHTWTPLTGYARILFVIFIVENHVVHIFCILMHCVECLCNAMCKYMCPSVCLLS